MTREEAAKILEYPVYKWSLNWDERDDGLEYCDAIQMAIAALQNINDLRNELCLKCGKYKDAHLGTCDGCRWKKGNNYE